LSRIFIGFLSGKRILITGVISNRSIAYGIAKACHEQGAQLAFTYVGERFEERVKEFAADFGSNIMLPCDVAEDSQIEASFTELAKHWFSLGRHGRNPARGLGLFKCCGGISRLKVLR
jgi:enoyl-[acyl-carrier protein] reductase I